MNNKIIKFKSTIDTIENIRTTMAIEKYFLSESEIATLEKCYRKEIKPDDVIKMIKEDIKFRMVK